MKFSKLKNLEFKYKEDESTTTLPLVLALKK